MKENQQLTEKYKEALYKLQNFKNGQDLGEF